MLHDGNSPSYGPCQIKLIAARQVGYTGTKEALRDPKVSIAYAAKYLSYWTHRAARTTACKRIVNRCALSAYNSGHIHFNEEGAFENQTYVAKVYKRLHKEAHQYASQ